MDNGVKDGGISEAELAKAFLKPKTKKTGIIVFFVGLIALFSGVFFMISKINNASTIQDAEYLVDMKEFAKVDAGEVIWNFTEVGKGTLTTNNHLNDYEFTWAIENEKLKIETKWLYDLNDEYQYEINMIDGTLTLINEENERITFKSTKNE